MTIADGIRALTRALPFDEHALGIKTLGDAVILRASVLAMFEAASVEPDAGRRQPPALRPDRSTRGARRADPRRPVILPELGQALGSYAEEKLRARQVEIKLRTKIVAYVDGTVQCADGEPRKTSPSSPASWRPEKKLRVAVRWALDVMFERDLAQYISQGEATPSPSSRTRPK